MFLFSRNAALSRFGQIPNEWGRDKDEGLVFLINQGIFNRKDRWTQGEAQSSSATATRANILLEGHT